MKKLVVFVLVALFALPVLAGAAPGWTWPVPCPWMRN